MLATPTPLFFWAVIYRTYAKQPQKVRGEEQPTKDDAVAHIGPVAEGFRDAFKLMQEQQADIERMRAGIE